jgi:hypothetical protein
MALVLSKTNIVTGNIINASDVTQSIDAFTKQAAYDITLSGSFQMTGSHSSRNGYTGSLLGTSSWAVSSSRAISSSFAITSSFSVSSSFAQTASVALNFASGAAIPVQNFLPTLLGISQPGPGPLTNMSYSVGIGQTGNTPPYTSTLVGVVGNNSTSSVNTFALATAINDSGSVWSTGPTLGNVLNFESSNPSVNFFYLAIFS